MNDEEFQEYIDTCFEELERKQQSINDTFGFDSFDQYQHDFEKGELYFLKNESMKVKTKVIPIGSFNSQDNTWMWSWANEVFPKSLRDKAEKLKELEATTGSKLFINEMVEIDQDMAWEITAVSLNHLNFEGIYHDSTSETHYFYAMEQVTRVSS